MAPIAPVQATADGRTAMSSTETRTVAVTALPAFGLAGASLTALAETVGTGGGATLTTTVAEALLFEAFGSVTEVWVISARNT
jgi:hypothetical protein